MAAEIKSRREAAAVAIEVRDKEYRAELIREIELKENRSLFLLQEIQFLKTLLTVSYTHLTLPTNREV